MISTAIETEIETFLLRLVPDLHATWVGATPEEIEQIEAIAGRPLPPFYQWFLKKMGRSMGTLGKGNRDFSASTVLASYAEGAIPSDSRLHLIGHEPDQMMPMHLFYDLEKPTRGDALVVSQPVEGGFVQLDFETLREMLAWSAMLTFRLSSFPQHAQGKFIDEGSDVFAKLNPAMMRLGFTQPIQTGSFCGLFERSDANLACRITPRDHAERILFFRLGANDKTIIRQILDTISTDFSLTVEIDR